MKTYVVGQVPSGYAPLPPENVLINGTRYPADISGQYTISWAPNPREHVHGPAVSGDETYTLRLYDETDTLRRTVTGITNNSYTWSTEASDSGLGAYNAAVTADSPTARWKLDETSGTTAADATGNGYNGAYGSGVTLNQAPLLLTGKSITATSVSNPAVSASYPLASTVLSAGMWIKATANPSSIRILLGTSASGFSAIWYLRLLTDGKIELKMRYQNSGAGELVVTSPGSITDGVKHYIGFAWDKSGDQKVHLYIDGVQVAESSAWNQTLWVGSGHVLTIYHNGGAEPITIDDTAVYLSYLSGARFAAHYVAADMANYNSSVRAELETVRGGVTSYQKQVIKSTRSVTTV